MKQLYFIAIAKKSVCKLLAVSAVILLITAVQTFAQSINGESNPCPGTTYSYTFVASASGPVCWGTGWSISEVRLPLVMGL